MAAKNYTLSDIKKVVKQELDKNISTIKDSIKKQVVNEVAKRLTNLKRIE